MKKMRRKLAALAAAVLCVTSIPLDGISVQAEGLQFTEEQIAANDNVLYLVNCGTPDATVVPDGYTLGLYQSNVDQEYAVDAETGLSWGHEPNDENSVIVNGGSDATSITGSYIYMADSNVTFVQDVSGFKYKFQLPERVNQDYVVTVGFQNPWSARNVDIKLEGETVEEDLNLTQSTLIEKEYKVEVTDGELNLMVHSPDRTSQYGDPVMSYIIVEAVPAYTTAVLSSVITSYQEKIEGHTYTDDTKAAFDEAIANAQAVAESGTEDQDEIKQAISEIETAYAALKELYTYDSITGTDGERLFDTNGNKVQAHGGQIQQFTVDGVTKYYWYGEDKTNGYRPVVGVHLYTSTDLYNWTDEGVVLKSIPVSDEEYGTDQDEGYEADLSVFENDEYFKSLYGDYAGMEPDDTDNYDSKLEEVYWNLAEDRCVIERPKVLYNETTGQYVMWYHADGRTPTTSSDYGKARAGVAVSDSPTGPFKLVGTYLLASGTDDHSWDSVGGHVRDMNLFKDDDGTGYVLYSSEGNTTMYVAKLNDSYTGLVKDVDEMVYGEDFTIISTDSREAPALFKYDGTYYLITSGCTGWSPNQARYTVAENIMGPWTVMGDPCVGDTSGTTFDTQSTCVFEVGEGKYIYMGDRWYNPDNGADLSDSRYVWLPVEFGEGNTLSLKDYSNWTLDELEGKGKIEIQTELPDDVASVDELKASLPETLTISIGSTVYENTPVTWTIDSAKEELGASALGNVSVTGTLAEIDREFTKDIFVYNTNLKYLIDCSTGDNGVVSGSATYDKFAEYAELINKVSDQKYTEESGWGYTSVTQAEDSSSYDVGSKGSADFYNCGWWAASNATIDYTLTLEPGDYVLATGYQEWWSTSRYMKVTATSVDSEGNTTELNSTSFRLKGTDQELQIVTNITVPEDSEKVLVSVGKTSGSDAVLSWIGVIAGEGTTPDTPDEEPVEKENLLVNGSFEDGSDEGFGIGTGQSIVEDETAPDGTHYLSENGDATSWGVGTSQSVSVSPNTEYTLTGTAKVTSGATYWIGANVDGREIYSVFSANTGYTDTTNTSSKYAYTVKAGATDWTDFEIIFTTGSSTSTINIYTWLSTGGYGYVDNLVLVEDSTVDWTEFDATVEEAEAKDETLYTEDSWAAFQEVLTEVKAFKEQATSSTSKSDVAAMVEKLEAAMEDLMLLDEPTGDVIYYVDAENGNDENDGTSPETAWKTLTKASSIRKLTEGGSILLKAGSVWNGEKLTVKNAEGTEENPIIIGSYGEGAKPVINGNGANWDYDTKEELAAVHIYNCENIIIENLEITNWDSTATGSATYNQSSKLLSGLVVENRDAGELSNVVVRNNTIHDVNGLMQGGASKGAGGLMVLVTGNGSGQKGITESWYDGLTIEGNEVYKVCHEAIYMESVWANRTLVGGYGNYQQAGASAWVGSNDVVIENNYVHDVAGDGIVPINTTDALVQYNLIDNSADTSWSYSNNPNHAAIWSWDSDNVVFRYNEACNTSKLAKGSAVGNDSMAFDFDYGVQNCLYEYNYSHDNLGGFLMLCPGPGATVNNIARYNVSVNDGLYDGAPIIRLGTGKYGSLGVQIYNNTMYWNDCGYTLAIASDSYWEGSVIEDVSVFNNIFYGPAKSGSVSTKSGVSYYNNCVYGGAEDVYTAVVDDENTIIADPLFVDVTDYTAGSWSNGKTTLGTAEGFRLQANSPCIDAGAEHPDAPSYSSSALASELVANTTEKPTVDYYGNALEDGKNDIGANEYAGEKVLELKILENPVDVSGEEGESVVFTVKAQGNDITYQWQYSNASSSKWYNSSMEGCKTASITVPVENFRDGQKYRCVVSDAEGNSVVSEMAVMTVVVSETLPVIISHPDDYTGVIGTTAQFEVVAEGTNLSYQWQYSNASSTKWYNSSMTGSNTSVLSVDITAARNGQKYRCIVSNGAGESVTSYAAYLIVGETIEITVQPVSQQAAIGENVVFTVEAEGEGLTYVWQYSNASSSRWYESSMKGNHTASLTVPVTAARNGQKYRCIITDAEGNSVTSDIVVLMVTE